MTLDDVISLPAARSYVGIVSADDDDRITRHRAAAVALVEEYLRRHILDRDGLEAEGSRVADGALYFRCPDVVKPDSLTIRYRPAEAGAGAARTAAIEFNADQTTDLVDADSGGLRIWPQAEGWPQFYTGRMPLITGLAAGMPAAALPEPWQAAIELLIRELYEGSAMDAIPAGSVVDSLLRPWERFPRAIT